MPSQPLAMIAKNSPNNVIRNDLPPLPVQRYSQFFGLPTQATANAMFDRVDEWLRRLAADNGETYSIKLMHSKAEFNPNYLKVPVAEDVDGDASVVVNNPAVMSTFTETTAQTDLSVSLSVPR